MNKDHISPPNRNVKANIYKRRERDKLKAKRVAESRAKSKIK
jgi:hypothetical protein